MAQKGFYIDMTRCTGCKACQIACKDKNNLEVGTLFRKVSTFEGGKFPNPWVYNLSISCNHCANAKCVENCPTGAMHKREDGVVVHLEDRCIGCRYCEWSCPFGAPQYIEEKGKVGKCNLCADLIDQGQNPACVDACVMRCIEWGDLDELKKKYPDAVCDLPILPTSKITSPSILIKPSTAALSKSAIQKGV